MAGLLFIPSSTDIEQVWMEESLSLACAAEL